MIDIDDDLYTRLFDADENYVMDMRRACVAVRKGKVIPKGHGRLIDADALTEKAPEIQEYLEVLAPTIIETDKGEE